MLDTPGRWSIETLGKLATRMHEFRKQRSWLWAPSTALRWLAGHPGPPASTPSTDEPSRSPEHR